MSSHSLKTLLSPWCDAPNISIKGLVLDHRSLKKGEVFLAVQGHQFDARQMIPDAIANGAAAIIAEADENSNHFSVKTEAGVPIVFFPKLKTELSALSARFYVDAKEPLSVIGVTGTNGKTTITQLIAQWLTLLDKPTAVMGTTGNGFLHALIESKNTTGSALAIQQQLATFQQQGADYVAMEVSSHGLVQDRVRAVNFAAAIFTNLTRDHLDYHGSMEAYAQAKLLLFTQHNPQLSIINADDPIAQQWSKEIPSAILVSLFALSLTAEQQGLWLTHIEYESTGVKISFDSSWGKGSFIAPLVGEFNVMNLLLSLATLLAMGFDKNSLLHMAPKLKPVIGRMEVFHQQSKPLLVVDYAHTPDALEKVLFALRRHTSGKLWCIFGCGGDRDKGKRPIMAGIAETLADKVILTNDNPRSEIPQQIIDDMIKGMNNPQQAEIIYDRFEACSYAFKQAKENDVILIAGKGHENYQLLASGPIHYSDRETVQQLLESAE